VSIVGDANVDAGVSAGTQSALASARAGDFSSDAVKKAIETGASVAAAGACTALGAPELAPLCAGVAGKIVGPIAGAVADLFERSFGGPTPAEIGFSKIYHLAPVVQREVIDNFVSLGQAAMQITAARAAAGLPPVDPWDVLRYLGADLVPTDTRHPYYDPATDKIRIGPFWNYVEALPGGGYPEPSDPAYRTLIYQWGNPWQPPDFMGYQTSDVDPATGHFRIVGAPLNFSQLSYQTMSPDEIDRRAGDLDRAIVAWRRGLLTAAMVAMAGIGTEAAAVETARQLDALAAAKADADARQQLVDLAQLVELAADIAAKRAVLTAYGRGVTNGVTFLRSPPPRPAAEALAAL